MPPLRPMQLYLSLYVVILLTFTCSVSFGFSARVASIPDGDTIEIYRKGERYRTVIDLYGIDCPEKQQYFGRSARNETAGLVASKTVWIEKIREGQSGRISAVVLVKEKNVNETLISGGWAWVIPNDCTLPFCADWRKLEKKARSKRIGLWTAPQPVPPWEWREKGKKDLYYIDPRTDTPVWRRSP